MCTFKNSLLEWNDRRPLFLHPKFLNDHAVLNAGSRVDLDLEQLCMKPASIFRQKQLNRLSTFMCFPIWKSIYSNLDFNNTKLKLFRSIDEYYKPLCRKFFKIMYIYSQSKSFHLLTSFNWKQVTLMNQSPSSRYLQLSSKLLGRLPRTLACFSACFQDRI